MVKIFFFFLKEGLIAAFFKHGNSSTPKNAAIAQKNAALDAFYGRMFKT